MEQYTPSQTRYDGTMKYRRCGRSGILIPEISLGLWQNFGSVAPFDRSRDILRAAFDSGICHFDLANNYGPAYGTAEETFGKVMDLDFRPFRDEMFISTKAGYDMWPGLYGDHGSRKYLISSLDQSLKRMKLDYVDLFYIHRYDPETPLEETMQALVDIVRAGKALYVGISNFPAEAAAKAYSYLESRDVHCLLHQRKLNMIVRDAVNEGVVGQAAEKGTGFIAFSPLAQGLLTGKYLGGVPEGSRAARNEMLKGQITPELVEKLKGLGAIASDRRQTLAQMALSWVLAVPGVTSVIVGASSVGQLKDSMGAVSNTTFTEDELKAIDSLTLDL